MDSVSGRTGDNFQLVQLLVLGPQKIKLFPYLPKGNNTDILPRLMCGSFSQINMFRVYPVPDTCVPRVVSSLESSMLPVFFIPSA